MTALELALDYAARGWRVFPIWQTDTRGICRCPKAEKCSTPGKHPRTHHGLKDATTNPRKIRTWKWETANVGIATGQESKLVVIDVDPRHDGKASLQALLERLGELPRGPITKTGGGGWHLFFRHPERPVGSKNGIVEGIDIKADGGYIVAPPSLHVSGNLYSWQIPPDGAPLPEMPPAWLEFLAGATRCYTESAESAESAECAEGAEGAEVTECARGYSLGSPSGDRITSVSDCIKESLPAGAGQRHAKIFELVRRLKALPEWANKPADALLEIVQAWHEAALKNIGTKEFEPTWADFQFGWEEVKYVWGTGPVKEIFEKAIQEEPPAEAVALYGRAALRTKLAALCRSLQRGTDGEPFFLSIRQVGEVLGVSPMHGGRWLRQLCVDGILRLETKGCLKSHEASEYRYVGD